MPYLDHLTSTDMKMGKAPRTGGELNWTLTQACIRYVEVNGLSYRSINDVMGAMEAAKQEFYRRVAAPYEDKKIIENGDVYPTHILTNGGTFGDGK